MMFAHTLARDMGRVDVDGMMDDMTLPQFMRWVAYYQTGEPLVPWAFLAAAIANMFSSKKPVSAGDFLGRKKQQTAEEQKAIVMQSIGIFHAARKNRGAK